MFYRWKKQYAGMEVEGVRELKILQEEMRGEDGVAALNCIVQTRSGPKCLFVDSGNEFSGQLLDLWAYDYRARVDFSRPGKPTDNCFIETSNGSLRDECVCRSASGR